MYLKAFRGKAPVTLKLKVYASMPRACALFLSPITHWSVAALRDAVRWERSTLRKLFRMRPKAGDSRRFAYLQRTAHGLD